MPIVPGANRRVQQTGLNVGRVSTNAPIEAFGGGAQVDRHFDTLRQSVGAAFKGLEQVQKDAQQKADTAKVYDATDKWNRVIDEKRSMVNKTVGENALGLPEAIDPDLDAAYKEIQDGLANQEQKEEFDRQAKRTRRSFNKNMNDHMNREFNKVFKVKTESLLKSNMRQAIDQFADEAAVKDIIKDSKDKYSFFAEMQGIPKEQRDLKLQDIESSTHIAVIARMSDGGADMEAKEYYTKHKKTIDPTARGRIEKSLEEGSLRGEAQRKTADIVGKYGLGEESIAKARAIKDPKLQDETVRRIKARITEKKQIDDLQQEQSFQTLFDELTKANGNMDSLPPSQVTALPANLQRSLEARSRELREGKQIKTDLGTYYRLEQMASVPELREKFMKENLLNYRAQGKLDEGDFKTFSKMQADMRNKALDPKQSQALESKRSIIDSQLQVLGVDMSKGAKAADVQREQNFRRAVDQAVLQKQADSGKPVSNDELRKIVKQLSTDVITNRKSFWWDTTKPAFELTPQDILKVEIDDVPVDDRTAITDQLRRRGKPVTDENILKYYKKNLQRLRGGR